VRIHRLFKKSGGKVVLRGLLAALFALIFTFAAAYILPDVYMPITATYGNLFYAIILVATFFTIVILGYLGIESSIVGSLAVTFSIVAGLTIFAGFWGMFPAAIALSFLAANYIVVLFSIFLSNSLLLVHA